MQEFSGKTSLAGTALGWLFITLMGIAGVAALAAGLPRLLAARRAQNWPTASGEIISSGMSSSVVPDSADMYRPEVTYRYDVAGKTYTAGRIRFAIDSSYSRSRVEQALEQYPLGQAVMVHYDPADPSRACLQPGPWHAGLSRTATGLALLATAITLAILRIRRALHRGCEHPPSTASP
jgi:hypothetical protein